MSKNNLDTDVLKVAMYLRLSQDDEKYDKGFKVESNSISNQRLQINDFIDKNEDMELIEEYVDDGYSGINFERPAFKKMMEDVITGNIIADLEISELGSDHRLPHAHLVEEERLANVPISSLPSLKL